MINDPEGCEMSIVVLLPHMDDEVFIIPYLVELEKTSANDIHILFLTKSEGRLNKYKHGVREAESTKMLKKIVPRCKIQFLGTLLQAEDLSLHTSLDQIFKFLLKNIDQDCNLVISPHYEGGHIDHDSTSILAMKIAGEFKAPLHTFNLYSGRKLNRVLFKVAKPTELNEVIKIRVRRDSFKYIISIPFIYKSQIQTWIGIYPSLVWRLLVRGKCELNIACNFDHLLKPNNGNIFYENRSDGTFQEWSSTVDKFLRSSEK